MTDTNQQSITQGAAMSLLYYVPNEGADGGWEFDAEYARRWCKEHPGYVDIDEREDWDDRDKYGLGLEEIIAFVKDTPGAKYEYDEGWYNDPDRPQHENFLIKERPDSFIAATRHRFTFADGSEFEIVRDEDDDDFEGGLDGVISNEERERGWEAGRDAAGYIEADNGDWYDCDEYDAAAAELKSLREAGIDGTYTYAGGFVEEYDERRATVEAREEAASD